MICCVWSEILTFALETTVVAVTRLLGRSNMIWAKTDTVSAVTCAKRINWPLDGLYPSKERFTRWCGHSQTARHTPRWIMSSLRASERNSFLDVKAQRGAGVGSDNRLLLVTLTIKLHKTMNGENRARRIVFTKVKVPDTKATFELDFRDGF